MDTKVSPQQLTAINLRYGTVAKSLKTLAFADLSIKALYLSGRPSKLGEIAKSVSQIIGSSSVSESLILKGLEELKKDGKINNLNGQWQLSRTTTEEVEKQILSSKNKLEGVLERNFPNEIEKEILNNWFSDAMTDFFVYNGDEWVQSICKGFGTPTRGVKTLSELLNPSLTKHKLERYSEMLKNSFEGFLRSDEVEDQRYIMNVGYAMLSARLVAADIGADPITSDELRGSHFFVDTNFFYALQLESNKLAKSLQALGGALKSMGVRLSYIHETEEEYKRVWFARRGEILKLVEVYPEEIFQNADDQFVSTALARNCKNKKDFEQFFVTVEKVPEKMVDGLKLNKVDNEDVNKKINKAKANGSLKGSIQKWSLKMRPWDREPKSNAALNHDASIITVVEAERMLGNKTYILTLDRSLQACCAERAGYYNLPCAIYLEGLIQILAADNAGPESDAANFAPLLTSILLKRCVPPERMYTVQDLHWLYGIQKNIATFEPEKIKRIILEVTKARLSGKNSNDESLQRTVNRLYQEELQNTSQVVDQANSRAIKAEDVADKEKLLRIEAENKLTILEKGTNIKYAKKRLFFALMWRIPVTIIIGGLVYFLIALSEGNDSPLGIFVSIFAIFASGYQFLKKPVSLYKKIKQDNI